MIARWRRQLMTANVDRPDMSEQALANEPTDSTEPAEPTLPMLRTEPTLPMLRTLPLEPIDRTDPLERRLHREFMARR